MANRMDNQVGMKLETVYNTPVTVDRFYPYIDGTEGDWDTRQRQGQGIFVSQRRVWRGDRRVLPIGQGEITLKCELASRQAGVLLEAAAGTSVITAITGGSQGNFTSSIPNTSMKSYTIQLGKVRNDGTIDAETYAGCTAKSFKIECPEDDILTIEVTFDCRSFTTATALATVSYVDGAYLFDQSQGAAGLGGTLVSPTTTTLGSGLTPFANFRSWTLDVDHNADTDRWVLGGRNIPTVGIMEATFSGDAEYNDTTLRTQYLAGTGAPLTITHTTTEVVGAGFSQFQLVIPQLFFKSPVLPPMSDETAVVGVEADITTANGTLDPFTLCLRTASTVI